MYYMHAYIRIKICKDMYIYIYVYMYLYIYIYIVLAKIETDADCVRVLGGVINLSPPFSSSQSSMNINGNVQKQFSYVMTASGNAGSGQVQVVRIYPY
jgi:hypothetical protein